MIFVLYLWVSLFYLYVIHLVSIIYLSFSFWQQPQVILLKEGTDSSQGKSQIVSNINACEVVVDAIKTTLGPRGMDKLMVNSKVKFNWLLGCHFIYENGCHTFFFLFNKKVGNTCAFFYLM